MTPQLADNAGVWVTSPRRGITAHDPKGEPLGVVELPRTVCGRKRNAGHTIRFDIAKKLGAVWCLRCWPER